LAGPLFFSTQAPARILEAGSGHAFPSPSAAIAQARAGDEVRLFPGVYADCAVLRVDGLTLEGIGDAASVVLTTKTCQGKALLVADGDTITIRNLTLADARVPDGNGAGIRAEGGSLTVDRVRFIGNQDGILTADPAPHMVLTVRNSFFSGNGACLKACAHGIYAGHIARLVVEDSVFRNTRDGHHIKSRAARTEILGCDIEDGPAGTASYLIEAPNGGALLVRGNTLEKGPRAGNTRAAIAVGTEGQVWPDTSISVENNRFTNDNGAHTEFLLNETEADPTLRGNVISR
jgi:hypothetical protein